MKLKTVLTLIALITLMFLFGAAGCVQSVVGELETPDNAVAVVVSDDGNTAYVADATKGLRIIDVSDVAYPIERAAYEEATRAFKVAASGNLCYIGDYMSGIRALDTTDPDSLIADTSVDSILAASLKILGNYLFSGDIKDGLKAFEINTTSPYFGTVYTCPDTSTIMAMTISENGNIAYVVDNQNGLMLVDISDPINMHQIGASLGAIKNANDIEAIGDYLYVATSENIRIVDATNENALQLVDQIGDTCFALDSVGTSLYSAHGDGGLNKWDCSNPVSPLKKMSKTFGNQNPVLDITVSG